MKPSLQGQRGLVVQDPREPVVVAVQDEHAAYFADLWAHLAPTDLVAAALGNTSLWGGHDLSRLPRFAECVSYYLTHLLAEGAPATLAAFFQEKAAVRFF